MALSSLINLLQNLPNNGRLLDNNQLKIYFNGIKEIQSFLVKQIFGKSDEFTLEI